jgi:RNA polymerase sigma-70 factor (ECF subfamily)
MTDEQLVQGCKRGDTVAQRTLFEKFSRKMFGVCLRYTNSKEEAEDLLQEGFIKVYQNIESFKLMGSFEGWMRRIFVNVCLEQLRKQKVEWLGVESGVELADAESIMSKLNVQELLKLIRELPAGYKTIFNLFAIEGYSHKEISEELKISEGTSKSQYSRARALLIEKVNELNFKSEKQEELK